VVEPSVERSEFSGERASESTAIVELDQIVRARKGPQCVEALRPVLDIVGVVLSAVALIGACR
jgi:hypothetical protein